MEKEYFPSSSNVVAAQYFEETCVLQVDYQNGSYEYYDVPQEVYDGLIAAGSKGVFMNTVIKPTYTCRKI
jgi:uncharacterized protein